MKVLITGATGFIGRRVVAQLARDERFEVITASRGLPRNGDPGATHEAVDLLSSGAAPDLIARTRPTHLLHLAWNATPGRFWTAPDNLDWAAASLVLLRAFLEAGGRRAVLAGTCAEYDWTTGAGKLTETAATSPATLYGVAKDAVRRVACGANVHLAASVAWGRIFWLYGPAEAPGRLVSDVAAALAAGQPALVGEGRQLRDFLHVDDVAAAFVAALDSDWGGPFNIGSGEPVSVRRIVQTLSETAGRPDLVHFGARPSPPNDPPALFADTSVLRDEFGWRPGIPLERGLASTYEWWKVRGPFEASN